MKKKNQKKEREKREGKEEKKEKRRKKEEEEDFNILDVPNEFKITTKRAKTRSLLGHPEALFATAAIC